ncbi:MAG: RNA polymerase sigma-70 factor (ECF subfamily) [Roseivirga sp.]|jgi:RNA polymerase sigma-70 factor (ECF subfamily)
MISLKPRQYNSMELQIFKTKILPAKDKLYRIAFNMMRSVADAEDIIQDVMVKLWERRGQWDEFQNIEAFAVTITKNLCLDKLKAKRRRGHFDIQDMELDSGAVSPYQKMELTDSAIKMINAFDRLPDQQKLLVTLRDIEGFSYEEIAAQTGLEINNIRVGISRARKRAKEEYLKVADYEQQ